MSIKTVSRPHTRKGRATPTTVARPSMIRQLSADRSIITPAELQHQHLIARGLRPALAVITAALFFGEAE